jgi:two-component system phosphate regulon sensor histidine kinase PhoR
VDENSNNPLPRLEAAFLDSIPEPVILVDHQRNVLAANRASEAEIGVTYAGRALALSLRHPSALAAVDRVLAEGRQRTVEVTILAPTERTFNLIVAPLDAAALAVEGEGKQGVVLVFHDVTAERRAEQMRADFVANASHELRSPLSALVGFIETLRGPARDDLEARERFLEIMSVEAARMTRLIEDLLSLSAIEANEHVAPSGKIDVIVLLQGVIDALSPQAVEHNVRLVLESEDGLTEVAGDEDQLAQVFRNLAENAVSYGGDGKQVRIVARAIERLPDSNKHGVSVAIHDQGEGIPREHLPRLTERFYRVDKARSRQAGGTGLGLAIVKHIVNRHRGRLAAESEIGTGSTFTVMLPAA